MKPATIGIDCRLAGHRHAGIGRYIENLVVRLPNLATEIQWVYFFHDQQQADEVLGSEQKNVKVVLAPFRHYFIDEQLQLPTLFAQENLDLLHVPHFNVPLFYKKKFLITIHDLLWHEQQGLDVTTLPKWQYSIKYIAYRYVATQAVKRAVAIFVPAETIKRVITKYYPDTQNKVLVTKEGVDEHLKTTKRKSDMKPKTFLYVGSLYPHKNLKLVIDALAKLPDYKLLVVGTRNVFQKQTQEYVRKQKREKQVEFLGYVPDEKLRGLYQEVTALVQPSLSEGFGLTGVEAMAAATPVLASNIPIFIEIYQDGALYFDPHSVESFCAAARSLEKTDRNELQKKETAVAQQYSWQKMAEKTLGEYLHQLGS